MKNILIILLLSMIFVSACTKVYKEEVSPCDQNNLCPSEFGEFSCYIFKDFEDKPVCWPGYNPCDRCASKECDIAQSNPPQINCKWSGYIK